MRRVYSKARRNSLGVVSRPAMGSLLWRIVVAFELGFPVL
jgi:hypothetical protein